MLVDDMKNLFEVGILLTRRARIRTCTSAVTYFKALNLYLMQISIKRTDICIKRWKICLYYFKSYGVGCFIKKCFKSFHKREYIYIRNMCIKDLHKRYLYSEKIFEQRLRMWTDTQCNPRYEFINAKIMNYVLCSRLILCKVSPMQ